MTAYMRRTAGFAVAACVLAVAGAVTAPTIADAASNAEARVAWATRHVETVCRPLEAQGRSAEAAKCFEKVSSVVADPKATIPGSLPVLRRTAGPSASPVQPHPAVAAHPARVAATTSAKHHRLAQAVHHRRRIVRAVPVAPARPVVVASNDQPLALIPARHPRFVTMLGVGY